MESGALSTHLRQALETKNISVDVLAERTKIPRSTIRALIGEPVSAILPEHVYLRGHLKILSKELGLDDAEVRAMFDAENPPEAEVQEFEDEPRFGPGTLAVAAGCGCLALLAIVLAFVQ